MNTSFSREDYAQLKYDKRKFSQGLCAAVRTKKSMIEESFRKDYAQLYVLCTKKSTAIFSSPEPKAHLVSL